MHGYKSFLVCDCETKPPDYILSIRDIFKVRHYQRYTDWVINFVRSSLLITFKTVIELISYCTQLTRDSWYPVQDMGVVMDGTVISNIHFTKMVEVYVATNFMNYRKVVGITSLLP